MSQEKQREIARLESELNCLKREREVLDNECERRRCQLTDQMKMSTTAERSLSFVNQILHLNNEHFRNKEIINRRIYETRQAYFKKLQE